MSTVRTLTFGDLLRRYRAAAGLTQEELATKAGLSPKGISDLERGARRAPRRDTVLLLAKALGLGERERGIFAAAGRQRSAAAVLTQERPASLSAASVSGAGGLPALVGRAAEIELVERHLVGEHTPLLLFAGEPGMGKSRLLHEAILRASEQGLSVLVGGCHRRSGQEPYAPFVAAIERHLAQRSSTQRRADLQGCAWLVRLLPELADAIPAVTPAALPLEHERRLMFGAVARYLTSVAGPAGTLLVLDDLHWAGPDALDLLAYLVRRSAERPLRILGAYRDTEVRPHDPLATLMADLGREGLAARATLGPLMRAQAEALIEELLANTGSQDTVLRRQLLQRAEGVPFFLVSCAQGLRTGTLSAGAKGSGIPWNVTETVRQRVMSLPEAAQALLGAAAVIGRDVPHSLLVAVAAHSAQSEQDIVAPIEAACQARLLVEEGERSYQFAHDLVREVVEGDLSAARRVLLQRQVAEALEQRGAETSAETLAYHYGRSDTPEKALPYLEQAGDNARTRSAPAEAEWYYRELVARLDALHRPLDAARIRERLSWVLLVLGRHDEALTALDKAIAAYSRVGTLEDVGRATAQLGRVHVMRRTPEEGIVRLQPLLDPLAQGTAPSPSLAAVYLALLELYYIAGRYGDQLRAAERAKVLAVDLGDVVVLAETEGRRALALLYLGRVDEALCMLETIIPLLEHAENYWALPHALHFAALAYQMRGEFDVARRYAEQGLAAAERMGPAMQALVLLRSGSTAFYLGDWQRAYTDYTRAIAELRQAGAAWISTYPPLYLAQLCLLTGREEEGAAHLRDGLALAEQSRDLQGQREVHSMLAERELLEGRPAAARERLIPLLDRPGQRELHVTTLLPLVAWAVLEMGEEAECERLLVEVEERAGPERLRLPQVEMHRVQALLALHRGQFAVAEVALEEGMALARAMSYPYAEAKLLYTAGLVDAQAERPDAARQHFAAALAILGRLGEQLYAAQVESALAKLAKD